jgi:hypothetical protein
MNHIMQVKSEHGQPLPELMAIPNTMERIFYLDLSSFKMRLEIKRMRI